MGLAIYDTQVDMFVTSIWAENTLHKILRLWKCNHPNINLGRFEIRTRYYQDEPEYCNIVILLVEKDTNIVATYYHWENRGYAESYDKDKYFKVKYTPTKGTEIQELFGKRLDRKQWDRTGKILQWGGIEK